MQVERVQVIHFYWISLMMDGRLFALALAHLKVEPEAKGYMLIFFKEISSGKQGWVTVSQAKVCYGARLHWTKQPAF